MGYDPAARRRLGALEVTQLGLGTAPLSGFRGAIPEHRAGATIQTAYDAGVRLFDTAPFYGYGRSELRVGHVLRQVPRESFVLSTKVGRWMKPLRPGDDRSGLRVGGLDFAPEYDLSSDGVLRSIEQSHARLGIATLDMLLIHDVDPFTHGSEAAYEQRHREAMAGAYPTLHALRAEGVIRAIGVGLNETAPSLRFAREADLDCILLAGRYTLLEQGALDELLPLCVERDIGIMLGGPFNSGVLATGLTADAKFDYAAVPPAVVERVQRIEAVCARHGVELAAAALQFPLAHPAVRATIPGAMAPAEVAQNVARLQVAIPAEFWAELKHEGLLRPDAPVPA